jgi:nucleolar protein 4
VRSAFVVTEQGTGVSKGVGYVSFALKEDAESAYETLSKDGINLVNRKLRVQWADSKVRFTQDILLKLVHFYFLHSPKTKMENR